jgi:uncharacterized protein (TIGR03435 family)
MNIFLFLSLLSMQPSPRFETVSVRMVPQETEGPLRSQDFDPVKPGGRYFDSHASLFFMIAFAYNVTNPSSQLGGLPQWAKNRNFSVSASAGSDYPADLPAGENRERVRAMLRNMLEDRFQLRVRTEIRQEQTYELHTAKQGFQIPAVDPPVPPARAGYVNAAMSDASGRIVATKATMAGMAQMLQVFLRRPVADRTGLTGHYDFDEKWESPNATEGSLGAEGIAMLISTLRTKFGLELKGAKGPVTHWVVDRIEPPSEN